MAYKLTLTKDERKAFDFVGYRYATGSELASFLINCMNENESWDDEGDITFNIPEYAAWCIESCAEEDNSWPLFCDELKSKMQKFVGSIV